MASQIRRVITSSHVRSFVVSSFRPTIFSRQLFNNIRRTRSFSTTTAGEFDYNKLEPIHGSYCQTVVYGKEVKIQLPGLKKTETDEKLCVFLKMPGINRINDVIVISNYKRMLLISTRNNDLRDVSYHATMRFPPHVDQRYCENREIIKDGLLKITFNKINLNELNFFKKAITNIRMAIYYSSFPATFYYGMMAGLRSTFLIMRYGSTNSFAPFCMCTKRTPESLTMRIVDPTHDMSSEEVEEEGGGVSVSINMPELKKEDVKLSLKHGALYIVGKTKIGREKVNYFTVMFLPNSLVQNHKMIKTSVEMKEDGMFKVTISPLKGIYREIKFLERSTSST